MEEHHDFGYGLRKEFWRRGIVTEAGKAVIEQAQKDGLPYITATHDRNNPRSGGVMQNVGMSYAEVKKSINSQILTVFFLPLIMAGIHVAFAFPMINIIMGALALMNTTLFAVCTLGCFALFSVVYVVVYILTAKVYYRIVKNG